MEQFHNALGMLDLMQEPAFCVQSGTIIKVNPAAAGFLIDAGTTIQSLLYTGLEEYTAFSGGCLYLTLAIAGQKVGASVTRMQEFDVFCIERDDSDVQLQAMSLAARELREPLSNVMTLADKLFPVLAQQEDGKVQEQVAHINRGLFQMLRIIGNMSDASRYASNHGTQQEIRDICTVLEEVFHRAAALTEHTKITLEYTGYPDRIYMLTDAAKLERMVFNIISNAVKFTPEGGTITAKLIRRGTKMYLSVCDSGSGIAENLRGSLFTRYTREPGLEDGRYGVGLGMVLIRSTAAAHGGTVLIDHPDNCGTRITVSLAIRQGDSEVRSPRFAVDYAGERDHGLIELSDVLPARLYDPDTVN